MNGSSMPEFFQRFPMRKVGSDDVDVVLSDGAQSLSILFLWDRNCPECEVAKQRLLVDSERFRWPDIGWLQADVDADPQLGARFGVRAVPTFMLFRGSLRLGRISAWPGDEAFCAEVAQQIAALDSAPG